MVWYIRCSSQAMVKTLGACTSRSMPSKGQPLRLLQPGLKGGLGQLHFQLPPMLRAMCLVPICLSKRLLGWKNGPDKMWPKKWSFKRATERLPASVRPRKKARSPAPGTASNRNYGPAAPKLAQCRIWRGPSIMPGMPAKIHQNGRPGSLLRGRFPRQPGSPLLNRSPARRQHPGASPAMAAVGIKGKVCLTLWSAFIFSSVT